MPKFKLKSSQTHYFEAARKKLGGLVISFVLVLTSGVLVLSMIHLSGRKTSENDTPFRRNGEVLSAQESIGQNKLPTGANLTQYTCPDSSPIKGILDSSGKKYYLKPSNSQYFYTKPDSCFGTTQNAEAEEYQNLDGDQNQSTDQTVNQAPEPIFSPNPPTMSPKLDSQPDTNQSQNVIYEATLEQLTKTEPAKTSPKPEVKGVKENLSQKLPQNLSFEQILERSRQTKIIVVNLATQNLQTLDNGQILINTEITSGRKTFETPLGARMVLNKAQDVRLKAPSPRFGNYDLPAKYWIGIGNGYGFHDAAWRSTFGGDDYVTTGSHGCINMQNDAVKSLYNWADTDTEVYII